MYFVKLHQHVAIQILKIRNIIICCSIEMLIQAIVDYNKYE